MHRRFHLEGLEQRQLLSANAIITVAGNGNSGYCGDGGLATAAKLCYPQGVAVDGAGDIFIADSGNNVVREVNASTGIITTVAGNGSGGYSGDGGPATSATLSLPKEVAVDAAGNLYIDDEGNGVIRRVDHSTHVITTYAGGGPWGYLGDGGPATGANLNAPCAIALDASGNLFIADSGNYRVREVNVSTGIITTVAGDGVAGCTGDNGLAASAELSGNLTGLAVDTVGDLFISDNGNDCVRRVDGATHVITTYAGNGVWGYSGDGGPATSAELRGPEGLAVDAAGDLFIPDAFYTSVIREVNPSTHVITTVAGNGTYGFSGDGGAASSAQMASPYDVAADDAGNLYIADMYNSVVREVSASGSMTGSGSGSASGSSTGSGSGSGTATGSGSGSASGSMTGSGSGSGSASGSSMGSGAGSGSATGSMSGSASGSSTGSGSGSGSATGSGSGSASGSGSGSGSGTASGAPPVITNFTAAQENNEVWILSGTVTDSGVNVAGMTVSFGGVFAGYGASAVVNADGSFSETGVFEGLQSGTATAQTTNPLGQASNLAETIVVD